MTSEPHGIIANQNSSNVRTEEDEIVSAANNNHRSEHLSQTGEEFSEEFIRDRIGGGIKRVNVIMPNLDHSLHRGMVPDFRMDQGVSIHYEDARGLFDLERCNNMDCSTSGSAFFNSPIIRNPIQSPFSHHRRTSSGGGCHNEGNPWEAFLDPLAAILSLSESPQSYKLKFLCSYGGRILPRPSDGRLRYVGGETRIICIRRNVSWEELVRKTSAICNHPHMIKYQLPGEDLDALISVCSDEDLQHLIEEYGELEQNGNSQRLRIFLISLSECESSRSFEVRSEQQQDVDYQYVVAVNGMLNPSPRKSIKVGNQAFQLGGSSSDQSPGVRSQRDSPTYLQAIDERDCSPSSHLMLTPQSLLTAPSHMHGDVIGSSSSNALGDRSNYYGGSDGNPSFAATLHERRRNLSAEEAPVNSDSLQKRIPSGQDDNQIIGITSEKMRVIPRDYLVNNSADPVSWFGISMEKDTRNDKIINLLSDSQPQENSNGDASTVEGGHVTCAMNISTENIPLLAYSNPSQDWYMKSQDNTKADTHNTERVTMVNEVGDSRGDDDGISSLVDAKAADKYHENDEIRAEDLIAENNCKSYRVRVPLNESVEINISPAVNRSIDYVPLCRISVTSSAIEECFGEINAGNIIVEGDPMMETIPYNGNSTVHDERSDQGTIRPLIVEDVTEKTPDGIPFSPKVIKPHVQDDPEPSESIVSSLKDLDGTATPDTTDLEDVKSDDQDDREDPISDAAMAEIEAGIYGLQIIKNADLEELRELGSGTFGTVYHGKWRGTDVAIKRIKKSCFAGWSSEQERITKDFWREAKILSNLHHPNVVAFYGVVPDGPGGTLSTVTEFMVNGSLRHNLVRNSRLLDRRKKVMLAMDAAFGMEYLHLKNIVHFDLKCDNLLVNLKDPRRPICKVGDFGLSRIKQNTLVSGGIRGTLPWMAPELLNGTNDRVSEKVDIYSFGIAMWEMLTGEEPYGNMHCGAIIGGIVNNNLRPPISERCDIEWQQLMEQCWSADPLSRPSFTEITQRLQEMLKTMQLKRYSSSDKPK